ncbi:YdcF family protein [Kribbella sp. DT2]|uniref:YdcF family protein n=1 Tax=Kribbella sp. DT2 TaxID=3393427 RepID=UPI003CFB4063
MIFGFGIAAFWFVLFVISFVRDRRVLRNGVYLVLTVLFAGIGTVFALAEINDRAASLLIALVLVGLPLTIVVLAVALIGNGVVMLRREGRRPANLLSLAAGVGFFAYVVFTLIVQQTGSSFLAAVDTALLGVIGYVSFLFVCFLAYAFVYARIRFFRRPDFIVVLGSGLRGRRVPPLLASRLDKAQAVWQKERDKGRTPLLITSGGQGPGEEVAEAVAMADYLIDHGVPADAVLREDRSTTTYENLTFSHRIMAGQKPKYRCLVVTNNFHALRAAFTARKAKVNGHVLGSPTARYFWPSATIREFIAVLVDHKVANGIIIGLILVSSFARLI